MPFWKRRKHKKRKVKYVYKDRKVMKGIPIDDELSSLLEEESERFKERYGREHAPNDFLLPFAPIYNDEVILQTVYLFRKLEFPENKIYAYYMSDGLFPCDQNLDVLSDSDLEEFSNLCSEYDELMNAPLGKNVNIIQFVSFANTFLKTQLDSINVLLIETLNDFIHRHCGMNVIYDYQI